MSSAYSYITNKTDFTVGTSADNFDLTSESVLTSKHSLEELIHFPVGGTYTRTFPVTCDPKKHTLGVNGPSYSVFPRALGTITHEITISSLSEALQINTKTVQLPDPDMMIIRCTLEEPATLSVASQTWLRSQPPHGEVLRQKWDDKRGFNTQGWSKTCTLRPQEVSQELKVNGKPYLVVARVSGELTHGMSSRDSQVPDA